MSMDCRTLNITKFHTYTKSNELHDQRFLFFLKLVLLLAPVWFQFKAAMALLAVDKNIFSQDLYLRKGGKGRVKEIILVSLFELLLFICLVGS